MTDEVQRWTFGVEPLDQTAFAADLVRRITGQLVALERHEPAVDRLLEALRLAEAELASRLPPDPSPRVGDAVGGDGRVYIDHARNIGSFNPLFPVYKLEVVDEHRAVGTVTFPLAYEGPPGVVHGGFLALFCDCVVQHHNCDVGLTGKTTDLALRYRRPAPLHEALDFAVARSVEDGRIRSLASLTRRGELLCEATVVTVAGDRTALPAVSPRRDRAVSQ